ncbi:MAG: membrane protein insertion efficiency factor YidD [Thermodesulfobacteriota bacterium]
MFQAQSGQDALRNGHSLCSPRGCRTTEHQPARDGAGQVLRAKASLVTRRFVSGLIRLYQLFLSPLFPSACRFYPTCSEYAREAVSQHGIWRGLWLALLRLIRCRPFGPGGFDPVP